MFKFFIALVLSSVITFQLISQTIPNEGAMLNYRLVGFSFPAVSKINKYTLEIAAGEFSRDDSFKKYLILSTSSKNNKIIAEVPAFGKHYTWRVVYESETEVTKSELYHFSTGYTMEVDTSITRLRVIKPAAKYKDSYVFMDGNRVIYDMMGRPVWYLPGIERFSIPVKDKKLAPSNIFYAKRRSIALAYDLHLSPQGTITFIFDEQAYEINYNGDILWQAPRLNKANREIYHHEFTRLASGNYMVLKSDFQNVTWTWQHNSLTDSTLKIVHDSDSLTYTTYKFHQKTELPILVEYDHNGRQLWVWQSFNYFLVQDSGKDLEYCMATNSLIDREVHANAFYFDEKDSVIYVSFKNISRIVKIAYPSGKLLGAYGDDHSTESAGSAKKLFCYQHCCRRSQDGSLYLFNNNICNPDQMPKVEILEEPKPGHENLKIIWEYMCVSGDVLRIKNSDGEFNSGGSVMELPDRSIFVSMGSDNAEVFIVDHDKKIMWDAVPELKDYIDKEWHHKYQYRASIIDRKEMERLVWNTGTEK